MSAVCRPLFRRLKGGNHSPDLTPGALHRPVSLTLSRWLAQWGSPGLAPKTKTRAANLSSLAKSRGADDLDQFAELEAQSGDDRARTDNPRLAKPVLSQLSYIPV